MDTVKKNKDNDQLKKIWANFYEIPYFPTYDEIHKLSDTDKEKEKYLKIGYSYFNIDVYYKRLKYVIEPFLNDANERARCANTKAYVFAIGLGLGVWVVHNQQKDIMLEVYYDLLTTNNYDHIGVLNLHGIIENFTYEWNYSNAQFQNEESINNTKILFTHYNEQVNPADKLTGEYENYLLVAMYRMGW